MSLVQITFSANEVEIARKIFEFVVWPFAGYLAKSGMNKLKTELNGIITANVNRIETNLQTYFDDKRSDLIVYIDNKFIEHEKTAFSKIGDVEIRLNNLEKAINEINGKLSKL